MFGLGSFLSLFGWWPLGYRSGGVIPPSGIVCLSVGDVEIARVDVCDVEVVRLDVADVCCSG